MKYVTLNTGVKMPMEGFGVFQIPDLKQCEQVTYDAVKVGYRMIDTAAAYMAEIAKLDLGHTEIINHFDPKVQEMCLGMKIH